VGESDQSDPGAVRQQRPEIANKTPKEYPHDSLPKEMEVRVCRGFGVVVCR
jgi:hypothetical protein